ncbi:MAG: pyrroline-5-carboxylate reductase [Gammaproteobacteria bacterium]|nr:MAG: pyrroline-5-carboxylate reductase [Gammaproteobacteria bacterium]
MEKSIAIIGAGHMGTSLIGGLINDGHPADKIWAANPTPEKLSRLQQRFHIHTTTDNSVAAQAADIVILTVKPFIITTVTAELRPIIHARKSLVISAASGIRETSIQHSLGGNIPLVRAMPNVPALIGCGATALFANPFVTEDQHSAAESIFRAVGMVVWLEKEELMDTVTALSGCGPAYFFLVMEALQTAAEELGLPSETARLLTLQTGLGAARMALESHSTLAELRRSVASPGGSTERALSVLEEKNVRGLFKQALLAAKQRAEELATTVGEKK